MSVLTTLFWYAAIWCALSILTAACLSVWITHLKRNK